MMDYLIMIHREEGGGYWADVPTLPGCFTRADTIEQLVERAPEAIESHLIALRDDGTPIPNEKIIATFIHVPRDASR